MADPRLRMELRLLRAALARRPGMVALAVLAVAIGASVASAMLHVSADVSRKLSRELRALGPNLLLVPAGAEASDPAHASGTGWLDAEAAVHRLRVAGIEGAPLLYAVARIDGRPVAIVGADLEAARRLHPAWKIGPGDGHTLLGVRLAKRLGLTRGRGVMLEHHDRTLAVTADATLEAGGPDDEAWWIPLADAQALAGLAGRASLVQARVPPGANPATLARRLDGGGMRATVIHALSATEAGLLDRMRRLMMLVTLAALAAAGLCAFGTLTDLALERRRDIALMKALGATRRHVVRQLAAESLAIGLLGGALGWLLGAGFAQVIGQRVFTSAIALRPDVPLLVIGMALVVSVLAGLGPIRLALRVQPAIALKGE